MKTSYCELTPKKWKFLLLIGRPMALAGLAFFLWGLPEGLATLRAGGEFWNDSHTVGLLLIAMGFVSAWTGKLGAYWFHG